MKQHPNQKPRPRGRSSNNNYNQRKNGPSRNQSFDSNGPNVRIRGSASQVMDKYLAMARDAACQDDRVLSENYLQHADHYFRIVQNQQSRTSQVTSQAETSSADSGDASSKAENTATSVQGDSVQRQDDSQPQQRNQQRNQQRTVRRPRSTTPTEADSASNPKAPSARQSNNRVSKSAPSPEQAVPPDTSEPSVPKKSSTPVVRRVKREVLVEAVKLTPEVSSGDTVEQKDGQSSLDV